MMQKRKQRLYITEMLKQHEEFIVVGITGRVGSGCSEAANILGSSFSQIGLPPIYPGDTGLSNERERDRRILYRYATHHWLKFDVIRVRAIITSFLLQENNLVSFCDEVAEYLYPGDSDGGSKLREEFVMGARKHLKNAYSQDELVDEQFKKVQDVYRGRRGIETFDFKTEWDNGIKGLDCSISAWKVCDSAEGFNVDKLSNLFDKLYTAAEDAENYADRIRMLKETDALLECLAARTAIKWWNAIIGESENSKETVGSQIKSISQIGTVLSSWGKTDRLDFSKYVFVHNIIPAISDSIHERISENKGSLFTELYQKYGNSIRRYGKIVFSDVDGANTKSLGECTFSIPRRINQFIKSIRHPFSRTFAKPTRIAIDSIKSALEANYLRERYSAFYLFAISTEENIRIDRLMSKKNLNLREIHFMDWNEYSNYGAEKFQKYMKETKKAYKANALPDESRDELYNYLKSEKVFNDDEIAFIKRVEGDTAEGPLQIYDAVRKNAYENKLYQFVLQDVGASIENADVFISNNHLGKTKNLELRWEIVRNVSLISHPGLLLPTPIERCMQAAFTAKANSGCLSRQVGAVVTDSEYNILSIGWNDVPCGDISCARKNLSDLVNEQDLGAYTDYEINSEDFRDRINNIYQARMKDASGQLNRLLCGLPWRYCFKDIHSDIKQPMRSRAMHAEEKALSNVRENAMGGCLFTTSSPCEMCSKNAKNHKIKKIYYIEPYPGISEEQYSNSGDNDNRAEHILFTGAIGRAYTQMYTPMMPHKDVLEFLGL